MKKSFLNLRLVMLLLIGAPMVSVFISCEKTEYEQTILDTTALENKIDDLQATVDANQQISTQQWNATMAALLPIGQQVAALIAQGNATQQDLATLTGLVNTLTTLTQGNGALLNQLWGTIQQMNLDFATMQALLQSYGQTLLTMQTQLAGIGADVSGINSQLALIYNQVITLGAQSGMILMTVQNNSGFLQQLIGAVNGLENMVQLVLQNQTAHGATLAVLAAGQANIGNGITSVLNAVNQGNLTGAQILVLVQQFFPALSDLGVNMLQYYTQLSNGINQLQLNDAAHAAALAALALQIDNVQDAIDATFNHVLDLQLSNASLTVIVNGISQDLSGHIAEFNAWKLIVLGQFQDLQLEINQQGAVLATIQGYAQDTWATVQQINATVLQLQLNDQQQTALLLAMNAKLDDIDTNVQLAIAKIDAQTLLILGLQHTLDNLVILINDLDDHFCCNNCGNGGNQTTIVNHFVNAYSNMYNYTDNSINVGITNNQVYNACANGYALCPSGPGSNQVVNGVGNQQQVCMITSNIVPIIQNQGGTINFGNMGNDIQNTQNNWGITNGGNCN